MTIKGKLVGGLRIWGSALRNENRESSLLLNKSSTVAPGCIEPQGLKREPYRRPKSL